MRLSHITYALPEWLHCSKHGKRVSVPLRNLLKLVIVEEERGEIALRIEISGDDAKTLVKNGCKLVAEGANMPTEPDGIEVFLANKIMYGPGKAANAGGVATSGLEMSQNAQHTIWTREEVDRRLHDIMIAIHRAVSTTAAEYGEPTNYVMGANIAGFVKVADSMIDQGLV